MNTIVNLIGQIALAFVPPKLKPFAKAVLPFVVALVGIGIAIIATGVWDRTATTAAVVGILAAILAFATPNRTAHRRR